MRIKSIATHLRPYLMVARRRTTINHAFASAVAPSDAYDEDRVATAMRSLGLDPDNLECAYCGSPAETWDHIFATVKDSQFSGYGHRLGNLLPCCKPCNSKKGNRPWESHLRSLELSPPIAKRRAALIQQHINCYLLEDELPKSSPDHQQLDEIRRAVIGLLEEGDRIAARIREKGSGC